MTGDCQRGTVPRGVGQILGGYPSGRHIACVGHVRDIRTVFSDENQESERKKSEVVSASRGIGRFSSLMQKK